jgi:small subunit ribosomal protein S1
MNPPETLHSVPEEPVAETEAPPSEDRSFADILSQFEHEHAAQEFLQGTVVSITADAVVVDIGRKMEGALPLESALDPAGKVKLKPGDTVQVNVTGRDAGGYYTLATVQVKRPTDWTGLQKAFEEKATIAGTVAEVVKGGLRVDVGVRAFLPASRSGARDQVELEKLVGQEIQCRITKLDTEREDVVVDRRAVLEEQELRRKEEAFAQLVPGNVVHGRVRTVTDYGAFVDLGGIDGLLHVSDMSWNKVAKPSDVVAVGDSVEVRILKVDPAGRRISLGMKQLTPDPWTQAAESVKVGDRVRGKVVRLTDFGAFVELFPGVDGLIHISSLSWSKKVRKPSDIVKAGEMVEAVVLAIDPGTKKISLGLKQAMGDPWDEAEKKFAPGTVVEGPVLNMAKFGAFIDLGNGLEGMIHVADITREKRLEHPREVLANGQQVRAVVLELDRERRRIRLGMKQLEPTSEDKFIAEHQPGESLSGRIAAVEGPNLKVEVAEGVYGYCPIPAPPQPEQPPSEVERTRADLGSMTAMLAARWKQGGGKEPSGEKHGFRSGQVHSFRIAALDAEKKRIQLELAG